MLKCVEIITVIMYNQVSRCFKTTGSAHSVCTKLSALHACRSPMGHVDLRQSMLVYDGSPKGLCWVSEGTLLVSDNNNIFVNSVKINYMQGYPQQFDFPIDKQNSFWLVHCTRHVAYLVNCCKTGTAHVQSSVHTKTSKHSQNTGNFLYKTYRACLSSVDSALSDIVQLDVIIN